MRSLVTRVLVAVSALSFASAPRALAGNGETLVDRVVAVVDGHPILNSEVQEKIDKGPLVVVSEYPAEETAQPYERALQDAINFQLVLAKAKDLEIDVRTEEVETEIKSFLESKGLTKDGLMEHLRGQNMTYEEYKTDFRDQMILRRFQGRVIAPTIKVTDHDVETYYLKKTGATSDLVELVMRQILVPVESGAVDALVEEKRTLALDIHKKLREGLAFNEAAKIYSDDARTRENGGLMAPVKAKDLAPQIRAEVENLEVGQFTSPVKTTLGFHIFLLEEKRFSGSTEYKAKKAQLEFELRNVELNTQTRRWLSEQLQKTKVEIVT